MTVLRKMIFSLLSEEKKRQFLVKSIEKLSRDGSSMRFFKDADTDQVRWIAAWSSNYHDDDSYGSIITESAHKNFIARVEKGDDPYPELWHWHTKGTRWGISDWLAYDDDYGMVWASGLVDIGMEKHALALLEMDEEIGVSHGMNRITYDGSGSIVKYATYEISDLPLRWAANKMTAMFMFGKKENEDSEDSMSLKEEKKEYLRKAGLTDDQIDSLDEYSKERAEQFSDRARKDVEEEVEEEELQEVEQENADEESETAEGDNGEETETPEEKQEAEKEYYGDLSVESIQNWMQDFNDVILEVLTNMKSRIDELEKIVGLLKQKDVARDAVEKERQLEPLSSAILEKFRAIGASETVVKEEEELAKDSPEEKEFDETQFKSASDFIAHAVTKTFGIKSE